MSITPRTLFVILCTISLMAVQGGYAATLSGTDLSATATGGSFVNQAVDEKSAWGNGWYVDYTIIPESLYITLTGGTTSISGIEFSSGLDPNYTPYNPSEVDLYYTTDSTVNTSSIWMPLQNLVMVNGVTSTIIGNKIQFDHTVDATQEYIISFDAMDMTAIRLDVLAGYDTAGVNIIEVTLEEEVVVSSVPEPASILMLAIALVGFIRKKCL